MVSCRGAPPLMSDSPPSLQELRDRFAERDPSSDELAALRADPRKGAQQLAQKLVRRADAAAAWARRWEELSRPRKNLEAKGFLAVGGVDEAGRGPLAGPVATACVVLPPDWDLPGLNDSKKLSRAKREELDVLIREQARGFAVDMAQPAEIDEINILRATQTSMIRAVQACAPTRPDYLLTDAVALKDAGLPFRPVIGGDRKVAEVAAASVLAKVARDAVMREADEAYPGYGFAGHKGYGTEAHMEAIRRLGPSPLHRRSFAPVAEWVLPDFGELRRRLRRARDRQQLKKVARQIRQGQRELSDPELEELRAEYGRRRAELER